MILRILCLLTMFFCLSNLVYSQTSVCSIEKGEFCYGFGYLKSEFDNLTNDGKYAPIYNNNDIGLGVGYGLTDTIKLTIIPSFKMVTSDQSLAAEKPYIGPQIIKTTAKTNTNGETDTNGLTYFLVGATRTGLLDRLTTEAIVGIGIYYKREVWNLRFLAFTDVYGKLQMRNLTNVRRNSVIIDNDSAYSYQDNLGFEFGLELKYQDDFTLVTKFDLSSKSPEIPLTVSIVFNN